MLFKSEKREKIEIEIKPSILLLAERLFELAYPFASNFSLSDLFEEMVFLQVIKKKEDPVIKRVFEEAIEAKPDSTFKVESEEVPPINNETKKEYPGL